MKEQQRSKNRKDYGAKKYEGDKLSLRAAQNSGQKTSNKHNKLINNTRADLSEQLRDLYIPEAIQPKFSIDANQLHQGVLLQINDGCIGYDQDCALLKHINLIVSAQDRIAICGHNGSGKSTLIKAILEDQTVLKSGYWIVPKKSDIGYLDQHYKTLDPEKSVFETISDLMPEWPNTKVRSHLNDFLFRKNEEVIALTKTLSGGEKARLSLAQIAAKTPKLLILDEITNNLDIETKEHIAQILKSYPGALIVISHEEDFLEAIGANNFYHAIDGHVTFKAK